MYDLDHMLDGKGSRQHHQDVIREAQQDKLARDAGKTRANPAARVRVVLAAIINLIVR